MYAGTTFSRGSGRVSGVHQRIDKVARRHITKYVGINTVFPTIREILHFEGINGPDGNKRKSPFRDTQWHFINPSDPNDKQLVILINDHLYNLTKALKEKEIERASFEAAWLAHAITDGLTPAHHYSLDNKIEELWGKPQNERKTVFERNFIKGKVNMDTLSKNWQYWGAKGVFTAHVAFEWGIAMAITGHRFNNGAPKPSDLKRVETEGFEKMFLEAVHKVDDMKLYEEFGENGWTVELADKTRRSLLPEIIRTVATAWYLASYNAEVKK